METILSRVYDQYDIICIKKTWASTVDPEDVNLFSGVQPETEEQIDIKDYLMDMSELSYDFDEAEKENGQNQLFYVASDMNFKLSGIENNGYLKTFFGLFTNTDYIKWHVKLLPTGTSTATWEGLINHESITLPLKPDNDSDIISVTALSFEKEFKEYFQGKPLPLSNDLFTGGGFVPVIGGMGNQTRLGMRLFTLINIIFPGTTWNFTGYLTDWVIVRDAILYPKSFDYGTTDNYIFIKSSYERISSNGENCYDLFRRICNAMGWVFYYKDGQFQVKDRSTDIPTLTTLDVENILDIEVSKYKESTTFNHVVILDGTIDGGDGTGGNISGITEAEQPYQMRGARMQILSDKNPEGIRIGTWWQNLTGFLLNVFNIGDKFLRYFNENDTTFNLAFHTKTGESTWTLDRRGCNKDDMLFIDAGDTGNEMWLYQVADGSGYSAGHLAPHSADAESPNPANSWGGSYQHYRVRFKGNYGSALVKIEYLNSQFVVTETYQDYVKTNLFYNNFQKFFSSRTTRKISIKYDAVITNPVQVFQFENDTEGIYAGEWSLNNLKINFLDETTTMELQLKLTERDSV